MTSKFQCPHCDAINEWPEYVVGKRVKCPGCRKAFVAEPMVTTEVVADVEVAEPVEELPEEPLTVVPIDEPVAPAPSPRQREIEASNVPKLKCAQSIKDMCERRDLQRLSEPRRRIFALLVASLETLRPNLIYSLITLIVMIPFIVVVALGIGLALMFAIWLAALALEQAGILQGYYLLYFPPGFVILTAYYTKQSVKTDPVVLGKNEKDEAERIQLGRLDAIFRLSAPATTLFFLGVLFSLQVGLLYFMPDHLGITQEGTLVECLLLTTDNLCHGVFLDTFELYDIHLAEKVTHDWWTATVYYLFRISFEAFALIAAYQLWRHYAMRRLFHALPRHWRNVDFVLQWIEEATRTEGDWAREFLDEFLFLVLTGAYLSGDDEMVRDVDRRFPWLRIREDVRRLYVDEYGDRLFEYQPEPD